MKWFKHFSTAMDDLFVKDLERKFGDTGYAFWFKTLELIAAHGKDGVLRISWKNYCDKLNKRRDHLRRILTFATQDGHLSYADDSEDFVTITCQRFAEIADNFTKYGKPLQSDFKVALKQEEEEEEEEEQKKKKTTVEKFAPDSQQVLLSEKLLLGIRANDPNYKQPDIQRWAIHIDGLLRLDGREPQQIADVIDFATTDDFWKPNILSTKKLREKFPTLLLRKNGNPTKTKQHTITAEDVNRARAFEERIRRSDEERSKRA